MADREARRVEEEEEEDMQAEVGDDMERRRRREEEEAGRPEEEEDFPPLPPPLQALPLDLFGGHIQQEDELVLMEEAELDEGTNYNLHYTLIRKIFTFSP